MFNSIWKQGPNVNHRGPTAKHVKMVKTSKDEREKKLKREKEAKDQMIRIYGEQRIQEALRNIQARKLDDEMKFLAEKKYVSKRANDKKLRDEDIDFIIVDNYY